MGNQYYKLSLDELFSQLNITIDLIQENIEDTYEVNTRIEEARKLAELIEDRVNNPIF